MNDNKKYELLSDVVRLVKKYGPETFEDLSHVLADPKFIERVTEVLETTAKVARNARRIGKKRFDNSQRKDFRSSLVSVTLVETEKGALLTDLYDRLKSKEILPTLKEMQNFALDNGLPSLKATSREKAIIPFVKAFIPMSGQDARDYLKRIQPKASHDRRLEGWSDIIFKKKNEVKDD